jgi:hypothetical protein
MERLAASKVLLFSMATTCNDISQGRWGRLFHRRPHDRFGLRRPTRSSPPPIDDPGPVDVEYFAGSDTFLNLVSDLS